MVKFNGRFQIVKHLGSGSISSVYLCRHLELSDHFVAVKVFFPEVQKDESVMADLRNRIFASYEVSHPNVLRTYEYFRDDNATGVTMEFVGGGNFAELLASDGPVPIDETVRLLVELCDGLQAIHDADIIHGNLKPENILLTRAGQAKISDFGLTVVGLGPALDRHGGVTGSIDIVSPEYVEGQQIDSRSDIYALGALAFELITGRSLFVADSVMESIQKRLTEDPDSLCSLRGDCPVELNDVVLKALARDPDERFQTPLEFKENLQKVFIAGTIH